MLFHATSHARPHRSPSPGGQHGMSLAELMIAMGLGIMIVGGMGQLFLQSKRSFNQDEQISRMQEDARFAMTELMRDISLGGFYADLLDPTQITPEPTMGVAGDCGPAGTDWVYEVVDAVEQVDNATGAEAEAAFQCIDDADFQNATDVISLKRVEGGTTDAADLENGDSYLQTNGTIGYLFQHPMPAPPAAVVPPTFSYWEYRPKIYYVRNYSISVGDGIPALCRKVLSSAGGVGMVDECIAEGIESMQIEFGVDTDGDGVANQYKPDPTAAEMNELVAVRVYLIARSLETDRGYTNDKTYNVSNLPAFQPNDSYYRRVYVTTILLRNPSNLTKLGV